MRKTTGQPISFWLLLLAFTAGCSHDVPIRVSAEDLIADVGRYGGAQVIVQGAPTTSTWCNAAGCADFTRPCNNCQIWFTYGSERDVMLRLRPADDWVPVGPAFGVNPQPCFDELCSDGFELGCHGNDFEAHCSPAVPPRIVVVHGAVDGDTLWVSRVQLADEPTEVPHGETWPSPRLYE